MTTMSNVLVCFHNDNDGYAAAGFVMTLGGGFAYLTKLSNERIVNEAT